MCKRRSLGIQLWLSSQKHPDRINSVTVRWQIRRAIRETHTFYTVVMFALLTRSSGIPKLAPKIHASTSETWRLCKVPARPCKLIFTIHNCPQQRTVRIHNVSFNAFICTQTHTKMKSHSCWILTNKILNCKKESEPKRYF